MSKKNTDGHGRLRSAAVARIVLACKMCVGITLLPQCDTYDLAFAELPHRIRDVASGKSLRLAGAALAI
ncbi:MAG: hypothetical protein PEGG_00719 [Paraeggerthella hongkongensis]